MCGIYGKFSFSGELAVAESISATHLLKHRGPDGYGFEYGNFAAGTHTVFHNTTPLSAGEDKATYFLGHRRLSIVDLSENAFQPMESVCERYSVVFNGEIYNYVELWEELVALGCKFKTDHSDTEALLNAYDVWGTDCLQKFRGMFAFAIFDRAKNQLFLARDRIGQKSVYFETTDESFTFASELPPIIQYGEPRDVDVDALNLYMELGYIPYPHSIFDGVRKLPPASYALIGLADKSVKIHEYWDVLGEIDDGMSPKFAKERTEELLMESVKYRLRADVTVGAFISGGTDSTLVVRSISKVSDSKLDIYGADFPNTDRSERTYIEQAASRYHQNLRLSEIDISHVKNIESIVKIFDEPFDGASSIALFDLFGQASKDHKIILTGDGGDEMFAGYPRYATFPKRDRLIRFLQFLVFPKIMLDLGERLGILPAKFRSLATYLNGNTYTNFSGLNWPEQFSKLLKPRYQRKEALSGKVFEAITNKIKEKRLPIVKALQYFEMKTILPGRMLYKVDRFSMAYSVEARAPFLDHKLAEFAYSIPDSVNIRNHTTKAVLKEILAEDFDDSFVHRTKQGFGNPLSLWFKGSDRAGMFAILRNDGSELFNYLDFEATHKAIPQLRHGYDKSRNKDIWRLLVLAHYFELNKRYFKVPV